MLTDRDANPVPFRVTRTAIVPDKDIAATGVRPSFESALTVLGIAATIGAAIMVGLEIAGIVGIALESRAYGLLAEQAAFALVTFALVYGNLVYQVARWGYMRRLRAHRPAQPADLNAIFDGPAPALTVLVPSYKEEARVVRQSLLSAALQDYPNKRVMLLIDDPPAPREEADRRSLIAARWLPVEIQAMLSEPRTHFQRELHEFEQRRSWGTRPDTEARRLARLHLYAAKWLRRQASRFSVVDHADRLFLEKTFREPAMSCVQTARELRRGCLDGQQLTLELAERSYRRLASWFAAELGSFERKLFANLSVEPNKAMNLNSYIGLLGQKLVTVERDGRKYLEPAGDREPDLEIPSAEFLITLDADSILTWDYALRLVYVMQQPGNERLAVVQTPYTAIPGATSLLERIAGATTDMQYNVHQGFTYCNATFWVGANALLRVAALRDIAYVQVEHGNKVQSFIADRTVIEDTESSVDLAAKGWRLFNYPRRMSYSATPADFGSLVVQRRRWANGGLIILPKLMRYVLTTPGRLGRLPEAAMRLHYLTSIALVNIGVPVLLLYPFESNLRSVWLPLTALFYFLFYGRDMVQAGYRWRDLARVYALNLALIPVNLAGVFKSIHQGWSGHKIPFGRTPKVEGKTLAPLDLVLCVWVFIAYCGVNTVWDLVSERWLHAVFAGINGLLFAYAAVAMVGLDEIALAARRLAVRLGLAEAPAVQAAPVPAVSVAPGQPVEHVTRHAFDNTVPASQPVGPVRGA